MVDACLTFWSGPPSVHTTKTGLGAPAIHKWSLNSSFSYIDNKSNPWSNVVTDSCLPDLTATYVESEYLTADAFPKSSALIAQIP